MMEWMPVIWEWFRILCGLFIIAIAFGIPLLEWIELELHHRQMDHYKKTGVWK